jgi:hypothetical protein
MYKSWKDKVECTNCEEWIQLDEECVLMEPAKAGKDGVETVAKAYHGVLCIGCYEDL